MKLMIDLETLGTKPNSAILSIGAVAFDNSGIHDEFYVNVDLATSIQNGFDVDPSTMYWWLSQDKNAGSVLSKDKKPVMVALSMLESFLEKYKGCEVWANSPSFDLVTLKNHHEKLNFVTNWDFWNERDFRTFLTLTNAERVKPSVAHNALEDAKAQAQTLINYNKVSKIEK